MSDNEYLADMMGKKLVCGLAIVLATIVILEESSHRHNGIIT